MSKLNAGCLVFLAAMTLACGLGRDKKHHHHDDAPAPAPAPAPTPEPDPQPGPAPTTTNNGVMPRSGAPPYGLTWYIGFNDNVSQERLEAWYTKMADFASVLWNVTEGQVFLGKVVITDAVAPGRTASSDLPPVADALDMMVFTDATWDLYGVGGYVTTAAGREGRIIAEPESAGRVVHIHEASHMIFRLTWAEGPLLVDEYADGTQDSACIMDLSFPTMRWCAADNHVAQSTQPHSCWEQILADYAHLTLSGTHRASSPVPPTAVEYSDTP